MTVRPPLTLRRLMAKAAKVAIIKVRSPVATAITSEFQSCSQKWLRK